MELTDRELLIKSAVINNYGRAPFPSNRLVRTLCGRNVYLDQSAVNIVKNFVKLSVGQKHRGQAHPMLALLIKQGSTRQTHVRLSDAEFLLQIYAVHFKVDRSLVLSNQAIFANFDLLNFRIWKTQYGKPGTQQHKQHSPAKIRQGEKHDPT